MSGYKTYIAAIGLVGLAVYQLSLALAGDSSQYLLAWQSLMGALAAFGLRKAITEVPKQVPQVDVVVNQTPSNQPSVEIITKPTEPPKP